MEVMPYQSYPLQLLEELPPHITVNEYNKLRKSIKAYWEGKNPRTSKKRIFYRDRDILLIDLCWETGGRINDIANTLSFRMFDFEKKLLNLYIEKTNKWLPIPLESEILLFVSQYCHKYNIKDKIFGMTRQRAWQLIKKYSEIANIKELYPHKFRHGLAIHLLQNKISIPIISKRLGHSNIIVTMQMYMKITPEIQREALQDIKWRD